MPQAGLRRLRLRCYTRGVASDTHNTLVQAICGYVAKRHNAGHVIAPDQSLFYSGMVDSLGIQELCAELARVTAGVTGAPLRLPSPAEIVENDLDTPLLIAQWMEGGLA